MSDDLGKPDRMTRALPFLLGTMALLAVLYLFFAPRPSIADQERSARMWCDRVGLKVRGVSCNYRGTCTVVPETGAPFLVACSMGCSLVAP